jgi:hypothetical protein
MPTKTEIDLTGNVAKWVWKNLVPPKGQAATVQGELLRAVEKLLWEAQKNGNQNWDAGFEKLLSYLRVTLLGEEGLASQLREDVAQALTRLSDFEHPATDEAPYNVITEGVVAYCRLHPLAISREPDPTLFR